MNLGTYMCRVKYICLSLDMDISTSVVSEFLHILSAMMKMTRICLSAADFDDDDYT